MYRGKKITQLVTGEELITPQDLGITEYTNEIFRATTKSKSIGDTVQLYSKTKNVNYNECSLEKSACVTHHNETDPVLSEPINVIEEKYQNNDNDITTEAFEELINVQLVSPVYLKTNIQNESIDIIEDSLDNSVYATHSNTAPVTNESINAKEQNLPFHNNDNNIETEAFEEHTNVMQLASSSSTSKHNEYYEELMFDSDDSVRDVTWQPEKRKRVSESVDDDSDKSTANFSATNLRNIVNKKTKDKPRSSEKVRRSAVCKNKLLRNTGKSYVSNNKLRQARQMKDLPICRFNCKNRIPEQARNDLFTNYWQLGTYSKRVNYISTLITVQDKKVQKVHPKKTRSCTFAYHVHWGNEMHEKVCKNCFLIIFDESHKFVSLQAKKKKDSATGFVPDSTRGSVSNSKWTDEDLNEVHNHILSFPQYESHYARNKTSKKFLPAHLNLEKMYSLYCEKQPENKRVCKTIYTKIFYSLKLSFKPPKVDTCTKCDMFQAQIQYTTTPEDKEEISQKLNTHQNEAEKAYNQKNNDKLLSRDDDSLLVLTFDLQQCLPTPVLSSGMAFYKRSLWTFNLTIHDCKTKTATCYMWHEGIGKRGGNQIASCLYDYIKKLPPTITKIILYSDTCGGQNKNSFVSAMFLTLMKESPHIQFIDHKFLVPGHTHMECDYDHSVIERAKKKVQTVHHPRDYYQMVRSAGKKGQFIVREMTLKDFYDFESLLKGPLVLRKLNTNKEKVYWPDIRWFRYSQTDLFVVWYKTNLSDDEDFKKISFQRIGKAKISNISLNVISNQSLPISMNKKKDLLTLLPFIDSDCHEFYRNLKTSESERDNEDLDLNIMIPNDDDIDEQ